MSQKQKLVCEYCGSDDMVADAYAVWNPDKGEYELSATFDAKFCQNESCVAQINGYDQKGTWVTLLDTPSTEGDGVTGNHWVPNDPAAEERAQWTGQDTSCRTCGYMFSDHNNSRCPTK